MNRYRHPMPRLRRGVQVALLVMTLSGCTAPLQSLPVSNEVPGRGSWVTLSGSQALPMGSGVVMQLPPGPYRAQFADPNGVYFASTLRLDVQTSLGVRSSLRGGVYLRHEDPTQAWVWTQTALGPRLLEPGLLLPVQLHTPR